MAGPLTSFLAEAKAASCIAEQEHVGKLCVWQSLGWRPSLLGWRPSLLGWRPSLLGWRPSLLRWRPSLLRWRPSLYTLKSHMSFEDPLQCRTRCCQLSSSKPVKPLLTKPGLQLQDSRQSLTTWDDLGLVTWVAVGVSSPSIVDTCRRQKRICYETINHHQCNLTL